MVISKSEFMLFLRHPAWLWLKKHDKNKLPLPDESLQALFDEGSLFEEYAERLFKGAVKLGYKNGNIFSGTKYYALPDLTKQELEKGTPIILQGRLEASLPGPAGTITAIFDALEKVGDNLYDLYEIKSSTSAKPEHTYDLAFQTIVLEKAGLSVRKIFVLHVNNEYRRKGEISPEEITKKTEITEAVREVMLETLDNIEKAFKVVYQKEAPDLSPRHLNNGGLSEWMEILEAVRGPLSEQSIYKLCLLRPALAGALEDMGVDKIGEIPLDIGLSEKQERQVLAAKTGKQAIDKAEIKAFIDELKFPIHFIDYETLSGVIPAFDGTRPYQQVPFQYSLHIWEKPGDGIIHRDYLHQDNSYPVLPLLERMREDFLGEGSVVSWNKRFEIARNTEMAEAHPEYANFLHNMNDRMVDLMDPFSKGWFVDKGFYGSASLKAVLPVLLPELSYKELEVSDGGQAQRVWMETILEGKNLQNKEAIMEHLRKYCTLDTYSMYALLRYLMDVVGKRF